MGIVRFFVEKRKGFDVEAQRLFHDIKENLEITALASLRILNRYDIEGLSGELLEKAKNTVFSEPNLDNVYEGKFPVSCEESAFGAEYLPGQYDQRADWAEQCVELITMGRGVKVRCAKIYVPGGALLPEDLVKIKDYLINPVDSREAAAEIPQSLDMEITEPEEIKYVSGFLDMTEGELGEFAGEMGFAMSIEDLKFCREYFRDTEMRSPTETELRVIDTYWSDHCRHTTFLTKIEDVKIEDGLYREPIEKAYEEYLKCRAEVYKDEPKDISLMDMAVMGMKVLKARGALDNLDESEEINACSISINVDVDGKDEDWLLMFKNETHNHPTEIEPFGGAATCLGGAIRDPLSGRAYVYQAMRVTGSGDPRASIHRTLPGKLPQRKISREAARGYSSYGNQIGLATGQVTEIYHEDFIAKRMEVGAVIGAVKKDLVVRETPQSGDLVILVGGRTGRDGCGGATGSSKEHTVNSVELCGAEVQKGNAPAERKLQRLFRRPEAIRLIKKCNDFGAGGVSVAIGELADGLSIDLHSVTKKYEGLDGTELAISESQERMAVVVSPEDAEEFMDLAAEENLESNAVAVVTDNRRLKMSWRGKYIVDISRDFLDTNGIRQKTSVNVRMPDSDAYFQREDREGAKLKWFKTLSSLNVGSQKGLSEMFDSTVGAGTILMPFGGKYQLTPAEAMAARIPVLNGATATASLMSFGYNPNISKWSPFHGAVYAVVESVARIVASGGDYKRVRLSFQEYFENLGKRPEKWGKPFAALLGALRAEIALGIPSIGGKDSMSGTFMELNVPPTLISFAVAPAKAERIISPEFKCSGNSIVYIRCKKDQHNLPDFEYLKRIFEMVRSLIEKGTCISAYAVKGGGICEAVSKMCFGNGIGAELNTDADLDFYAPSYGSFVLELGGGKLIDFMGVDAVILGKTIEEPKIISPEFEMTLAEAKNYWESPLESVFPTKTREEEQGIIAIEPFILKERFFSKSLNAKPKVLIPVFPGTNCEYESAAAFNKAGGDAETFVIKNLTGADLNESIRLLAKKIDGSQIIMLPGGFSAGDEPEGSGKFIAAVFRNPYVREATMRLLKEKDGLMLGICNGFQALIKLGLVPYGDIRDIGGESPTLTYNAIGRHVSCMVNTKIMSNLSPWLWGANVGDTHCIPVSHGEGRFVASLEALRDMEEKGQIAACYVDFGGNPSADIRHNPNGSLWAVEAVSSPDGRVLGKMGHSERVYPWAYKNIPGNKDQRIFRSGIDYFK